MAEQNKKQNEQAQDNAPVRQNDDHASEFLSDALKASFTLLKIIMLVLVVLFLLSGFQTVGSYEKALVLTFGRISGEGQDRVLDSGLRWVWPYPIQEIVRIPVEKKINLVLDSLWYYESPSDKLPGGPKDRDNFGPTLNPLRDGYSLTRGREEQTEEAETDYNIVHTKWQLTYQITNPELFFKNVYVDFEDIEAGQNYSDVIEQNISRMLRDMLADAAISTLVHYTIDDVLYQRIGTITDHTRRNLQKKLDSINCGITAVSVQMDDQVPPRQVAQAFWASVQAANIKETMISDARSYYDKTLRQAGGAVAEDLVKTIEDKNADDEYAEQLWSQLAGQAQGVIADAQSYRTRVVQNIKADADYFRSLLPEYRKNPELVLQKIWQDAVQQVFDSADEKMMLQPSNVKNREVRIAITRDPAIKKQEDEQSENK